MSPPPETRRRLGVETQPHVSPIARQNDHHKITDGEALILAMRLRSAGWSDIAHGIAHVVLAFRATAGLAAPSWVREQVARWLDELDDDLLDSWADALVAESADVQRRRESAVTS
jgi:hypothetical protein